MSASIATRELTLEPNDNARLAKLCGPMDANLKLIEERLGVELRHRGNQFSILGDESSAALAADVIGSLYDASTRGALSADEVHLVLQEAKSANGTSEAGDAIRVQTQRGGIRARGANQREYLDNIRKLDLSFGVGPAGTGKTFLAIACAVEALQADRVRRLVLVRPAVEAGERLGFLPGDMQQKVDPYLRPMFDALYEMMGFEKVARCIERNVIEVAPLAFMRGRTLNDSFVVLDEAQNTTVEQMKMFLTRIGFGSKAVVTGDITQTDLPGHKQSGLNQAIDVLRGVSGVAFTFFTARDVVRHPLVQRIVQAYESHGEGERST
ncbi:MAG: PhoH family protein [Steroidobacterales bacterium]